MMSSRLIETSRCCQADQMGLWPNTTIVVELILMWWIQGCSGFNRSGLNRVVLTGLNHLILTRKWSKLVKMNF